MASVGIIANPASGKDIRRLVSYATTIDNHEKVNIVKRILLSAQSMGIDEFYCMPDTYQIGWEAMDDLETDNRFHATFHMLDMPVSAGAEDSTRAAAAMERLGVGCLIVLGGDGTCRAVAKGVKNIPILPVSTGTNNVYPSMTEGTVAGMAAAVTALSSSPEMFCCRDKYFAVSVGGRQTDIALIDAVLTNDIYVGAKAVWDSEKLEQIFATRCHPASIGFSAVAGCVEVISAQAPYGISLRLGSRGTRLRAPIAAGILDEICIEEVKRIRPNEPIRIIAKKNGMVALDGEREMRVRTGEDVSVTLKTDGPLRVLPGAALENATKDGFFRRIAGEEKHKDVNRQV